jgi:hypothetical protein
MFEKVDPQWSHRIKDTVERVLVAVIDHPTL